MTTNALAFPTAGLTILDQAPISLKANPRNARTHSNEQVVAVVGRLALLRGAPSATQVDNGPEPKDRVASSS